MKQHAEKLRNVVLPSKVVGRVVSLKPKGNGEYLGLCPFHNEKTPSFTVSDNKGFYHCFGCGAHGDVVTFLTNHHRLGYKEALEQLSAESGIPMPVFSKKQIEQEEKEESFYKIYDTAANYYQECLHKTEGIEAKKYLEKRGLSEDIIQRYRLGFCPEEADELFSILKRNYSRQLILESGVLAESSYANNKVYSLFHSRVIFPIMNRQGKVMAFGGRTLADAEPKYLNSSENPIFHKGMELYGFNFAFDSAIKNDEIVVVEGYMDVLSLANHGIFNVVAPLGTAIKKEQIQTLWRYFSEPCICMDNDRAGRSSMSRIAHAILPDLAIGKSLKFVFLKGGKDPDEVIVKHGMQYFQAHKKHAMPLSEVLFVFEKESKSVLTPEQKADFKARLMTLVSKIGEADIKQNYKDFFLERFREEFSAWKKSTKISKAMAMSQQAVVNATISKKPSNIILMLALVANYPKLLHDNQVIDELIKLNISIKELDKIRNSLLSISEIEGSALFEEELAAIRTRITDTPHYRSAEEEASFLWSFLHSEGALEAAREFLIRLFDLDLLERIKEQIDEMQRELLKNPSEEIFTKMIALKGNEEQIKLKLGVI